MNGFLDSVTTKGLWILIVIGLFSGLLIIQLIRLDLNKKKRQEALMHNRPLKPRKSKRKKL